EYEILVDGAQLTLRGGKHTIPAEGIAGGEPGGLGACTLNPESPEARSLPSRFSGVALRAGDVLRIDKAGGGGYGPPSKRPFARVVDDVLDGYVTPAAAVATYRADPSKLEAALAAWDRGGACALDEVVG
ncbi:MAG: hydantoinase B/oxoprolinase family protein, partial [Myxococcales bacterium]|nr:hydantoinase B/oxoprolinase family protein [Myxococcales bacterium]